MITAIACSVTFARTYKITEPDALTEMEERYKSYDSSKGIAEAMTDLYALTGEELPKASDNRTYYIDPTYTLDRDIAETDLFGLVKRIIYPKGYAFNPVDYMLVLPPPAVVFNACDPLEREYAANYLDKAPNALLISSGCPLKDIKHINEKPVYVLNKWMRETFALKRRVSVITVNKAERRIEVNEIAVD
jgi:conjugal transfer pilus assembly protein TraW